MKELNVAAILKQQRKNLILVNLDFPKIPEGYVLVKMKYSGICHTQLNEIDGILGKDKFLPHCMGHEGVGEVFKTGAGVKKFKKKVTKSLLAGLKKINKKIFTNILYFWIRKK